jgi:ribosomal protein S24E
MIRVLGAEWGTAAELADRLGPDVTEAMIRRWRDRDGLRTVEVGRKVYSPLAQAAQIERDKRLSGTGRPRSLDSCSAAA